MDEESRISKLGYRPQKELIYNKALPYHGKLDNESTIFLSEIKSNLSKAVLLRELRPGCVTWTGRLTRYINLYGLKFSKDDHIHFVKLVYELILIPDLEPSLIALFAHVLNTLLKKQELLNPKDLCLPWRPLFNLMKQLLDSPYEDVGMLLIPTSMDSTLRNIVKLCRDYFPIEATKEMITEWRPLLCPFDMTMAVGVGFFETFLPTKLSPENHKHGFHLWFDEFVDLWKMCHNQPSWEGDIFWLFARLAENNIGYIDWEPIMPLMFSKILQNFQLPVGYRQQHGQVGRRYELGAVVTWIVATLGGGSSCQDHLSGLFKAIESYYHPSNMGTWHTKLHDLLRRLPAAFVKRIHKERTKKETWIIPVPETHKLTEPDITRFVESLLPVSLLAMFSRFGAFEASVSFHQLAQLRPELVIPPILERLYSALDTVTEPHRLTAALQCLVSVARPLVRGGKFFPEGPTHLVPLLMASLPAVDPNDLRKTLVTFQLITTISTLVPIVDCSAATEYYLDLTSEEQTVCSATAGFEDFVLQFMDRCFNLVESSALEQTRMDRSRSSEKMNREESMLEVGLSSTLASLLMQCSPAIFEAALSKLHSFIGGRVFEPHVAGKFAAHICSSVAKVNAEKVLRVFLPHLFRSLGSLLSSDDVLREETLDDELLFQLLLLSELVRCPGNFLLIYAEQLINVLERALKLTCREGYQLGGAILDNLLRSLTTTYPTDYRSVAVDYDLPLQEYLPIRDWGKPGDIDNLNMKWHIPSDEEINLATQLLQRFLADHLNKLQRHVGEGPTLQREQLQLCLSHVLDCLLGAGALLPPWKETPISLMETNVSLVLPIHLSHPDSEDWQIHFQDGRHVRLTVATTVSKVVDHLLSSGSDDTKSFFSAISIHQMLLFYHGVLKEDFENHQKNFHMVKKVLGCNLIGRKMDIRALLVDRVQLQHELRVLESAFTLSIITPTTRTVLGDLVRLSTSQYSEVRTRAQNVLGQFYRQSPLAYHAILDDLLHGLGPTATHEQLKGILYLLVDGKQRSLLVKHDWSLIRRIWPAIIQAAPSEKPSIIHLLDIISTVLYRFTETTSIRMKFTDNCVEVAKLFNTELEENLIAAEEKEKLLGDQNEKLYYDLIHSLSKLLSEGSLHWRHYNLAFTMLSLHIRKDVPLPAECVNLFVNNLIHDAIAVRKIAIKGVGAILKQHKRKHPKVSVDPIALASKFAAFSKPQETASQDRICPGDRWDNSWLQYQSQRRPLTLEDWNEPRYVHKTHYGFYTWPKTMMVYAHENEQPPLDRNADSLTAAEKVIYNFFNDESQVAKLITFLSLEDRKGKDKFDARRFCLFKGLFRNYGDTFLVHFRPHLERLVRDEHEAPQRCAAEIITGLIRGSKHWPFHKVDSMWQYLCPLLRTAFNHVNVESINDWGTAIATASENRDPNRLHWFMELILENPIRAEQGSFAESSRLYMLQGGISQQEWRVSELLHRLLQLLRPYLNHPYQNVRDRLGSVLTNIFLHDVELPRGTRTLSPRVENFVKEIIPQLSPLLENGSNHDSPVAETSKVQDQEERERSLRLLKTVSQWLAGMWSRTYGCNPEAQLQFLPYLCSHESSDTDKELARECSVALGFIAQTVLRPSSIDIALKIIHQVAQNGTWKARIASLEFLQVFVFNNLFNIVHLVNGVENVTSTVLLLLNDERLEVREKAAQVLGGLLHCDFLNNERRQDLLKKFQKQVSSKLPRRTRTAEAILEPDVILQRHAGILGLCAFVNAYPYDVPDFLPDILVRLGDHLNDPQPIPVTVKKTLSNFRRTHHDNWQYHKQKFSDDQLVILTDLLVSPNYYA